MLDGWSVGLSSTQNFVGGLSQVFKASDWPNSNVGGSVGGLSDWSGAYGSTFGRACL